MDKGFRFDEEAHLRARQFWNAVLVVYEEFFGDRPDLDAEFEEEEG